MHPLKHLLPVGITQYLFKYMLWFNLGYLFEIIRDAVNERNLKNDFINSVFIFTALLIIFNIKFLHIKNIFILKNIFELILSLVACYGTYTFSKLIS